MRLTAPVRFLALVMVGWIGARIAILQLAPLAKDIEGRIEWAASDRADVPSAAPRYGSDHGAPGSTRARTVAIAGPPRLTAAIWTQPSGARAVVPTAPTGPAVIGSADRRRYLMLLASMPGVATHPMLMRLPPAGRALAASPSPHPRGWRLSAWAFLRDDRGSVPLADAGQLGGSQAGARFSYRIAEPWGGALAIAVRASRPLRGDGGGEAAIGLAYRPWRDLPIELTAERRIAVERGGRSAWAVGLAGGVDRAPLPLALELDAYAQAGVVGLDARDLYVDGAVTVSRPIALSDRVTLDLGGGAWGGAQPGAARLDAGPRASLRVPVERAAMRVSLDWRERLAGDAEPGSGLALTVGMDF